MHDFIKKTITPTVLHAHAKQLHNAFFYPEKKQLPVTAKAITSVRGTLNLRGKFSRLLIRIGHAKYWRVPCIFVPGIGIPYPYDSHHFLPK